MNYFVLLIALSIAYLPVVVNGGDIGKVSKPRQKIEGLTIAQFVQKVITEGEDNDLGRLWDDLQLKPDHKTKVFERMEQDCLDNRYRTADVAIEKSSETSQIEPVAIILLAKKIRPGASESAWFRLNPEGSLVKAFRRSGKRTPEGHGVPGTAVDIEFDPDEAQRLLKRELDFWLKGIGLKKKTAETAKKDTVKAANGQTTKSEVPSKTDAPAKPATK